MLIGLPGSGKSYYTDKFKNCKEVAIVSSDAIRAELYGTEAEQGDPAKVFELMLSRTKKALANGIGVIYDATNLNAKRRKNLLKQIGNLATVKVATVFATPYKLCLERNAKRARHVPEYAIKRMYLSFQYPLESEGWDAIYNHYPDYKDTDEIFVKAYDVLDQLPELSHDNPHHSLNVKAHMNAAYEYFLKAYPLEAKIKWLGYAIKFHDIGKWFVKSFTNSRGEQTEIAHFYNHENCGAYDAMFISYFDSDDNYLLDDDEDHYKIIKLINYHMRPFDWDKNDKLAAKEKAELNPAFVRALEIMHDCDQHADFNC